MHANPRAHTNTHRVLVETATLDTPRLPIITIPDTATDSKWSLVMETLTQPWLNWLCSNMSELLLRGWSFASGILIIWCGQLLQDNDDFIKYYHSTFFFLFTIGGWLNCILDLPKCLGMTWLEMSRRRGVCFHMLFGNVHFTFHPFVEMVPMKQADQEQWHAVTSTPGEATQISLTPLPP